MKYVDWNVLAKLGLVKRINNEILHPLGLSVSYNPETGISEYILIDEEDWNWEYSNVKINQLPKEEIKQVILKNMKDFDND